MESLYVLMFIAGLTGGIGHCTGMCGPLVMAWSVSLQGSSMSPQLLYHAGRVTTYMFLGAILGIAGAFVGSVDIYSVLSPTSAGPQVLFLRKLPLAAAGVLIIVMGLSMAGWLPFAAYLERRAARLPVLKKLAGAFSGNLSPGAFYPMGLALGLIPCGLVYSALATAAGAGMAAGSSAPGLLKGLALMMFFGLGTVAPLLLVGKMAVFISARTRDRFYRISAALVIVIGIMFLKRTFW